METVILGNTGLTVSKIGFGCEQLGGTDWGNVDEKKARSAVLEAFDRGINVFDTADVYGLGRSEERLSETLGSRLKDVVVITKGGVGWEAGPPGSRAKTFIDLSSDRIVTALEGSLRRLRLDCIPIYLLHWPDPARPAVEALDALVRQKEIGKVRHIGLSNFSVEQVRAANEIVKIDVVEANFSLLARQADSDLLGLATELGIGFLAYGVLAQGLLSGKYGPISKFDESDRRHRLKHFSELELLKNQDRLERLSRVGESNSKTAAQVAIRWVLDQSGVSCAIVGAKTPKQVEENCGALGWRLSEVEAQSLKCGG